MPERFPLTNDFDLSDIDQEAKIKDLHEKLKGMMLRRLKRDVIKSLPTKSERILRVELSAMQTHYYKNILTRVRFFSFRVVVLGDIVLISGPTLLRISPH
jgi:chromodomain-helicase-DNA-binding protein 1